MSDQLQASPISNTFSSAAAAQRRQRRELSVGVVVPAMVRFDLPNYIVAKRAVGSRRMLRHATGRSQLSVGIKRQRTPFWSAAILMLCGTCLAQAQQSKTAKENPPIRPTTGPVQLFNGKDLSG